MAYVKYNPNPERNAVGDCTVRAIAKLTGDSWDDTYVGLALQGFMLKDMPSSNYVWGSYLKANGYKRGIIPNTCPDCYTVKDFAEEHPEGTYLLATGTHTVTIVSGNWFDTWDSGDEAIIFYWTKGGEDGVQ